MAELPNAPLVVEIHRVQGTRGETGRQGEIGPPGQTGCQGAIGARGERGLPGAKGASAGRFTRDGLVNLAFINTINPSLLAALDLQLPAACRAWLRRSPFTTDELVAEVTTFLARFQIHISDTAGYTAVSRRPDVTSLGDRLGFAVAASVSKNISAGVGPPRDQMYWGMLYEIVFYRGLEDDVTWP